MTFGRSMLAVASSAALDWVRTWLRNSQFLRSVER